MSAATFPPATDVDPAYSPPPGGGTGVTRRSRPIVVAAAVAVLIAVVAAVSFYLLSEKTVSLNIDGSPQTIETRAATVAELLADLQVATTPDDIVQPSGETELVDGAAVQVLFARQLITVVDGVETTHTVTERLLGEALAAVNVPLDGAAVSEALDEALTRSGMTVEIVTPKTVAVNDGGQTRSVTSTAKTVRELLADAGVALGPDDRLVPVADTEVTEELDVVVTRIRVENDVRTETITHDTTETNDSSLLVGSREVSVEGRDGEREVTVAVTFTNGEPSAEEQIDVTVTREPVTEVVKVGTKPAPVAAVEPADDESAAGSVGGEAAGLNWAALAECESSGNPTAVNPAGYYGLYQFSPRTWASVGGSGNPADATPAEQLKRAQILYNKAGVGQWPHCGPNLYK